METKEHNKLLNPEERIVCEQIAGGEAPYSQRAQALLAIDEGATQAEAAQRAGLTGGQVKYWLGKFRKERLAIYADALPEQAQLKQETILSQTPAEGKPKQEAKQKGKKVQKGQEEEQEEKHWQ